MAAVDLQSFAEVFEAKAPREAALNTAPQKCWGVCGRSCQGVGHEGGIQLWKTVKTVQLLAGIETLSRCLKQRALVMPSIHPDVLMSPCHMCRQHYVHE